MKNKILKLLIITFIGLICVSFIIRIKYINDYCHIEGYEEYPCEGATHYSRVVRNNNESCRRTKIVCESR